MYEDYIPTIVQTLIDENNFITIQEVADYSGFDSVTVQHAMNVLVSLALIQRKVDKNNQITYKLIENLKGIHLAKAAQLGIDLESFDSYFKIDEQEKKLALDISTKSEKIKNLDIKNRKPLLKKRGYMSQSIQDDILDNLILLVEASSDNLYEYLEGLAKKDKILKMLMNMHAESELALHDYMVKK